MRGMLPGVLAILVASPALAWTEPEGWGIKWGEPEEALTKKKSVECFNVNDPSLPARACSQFDTVANLKTVWRFRNGGLVAVDLEFSSRAFDDMMQTLTEKSGSPTQEEVEEKREPVREEVEQWPPPSYRRGTTFVRYQNRIVRWHGYRVQMSLEEHPAGRWSESKGRIILTDELRRQYR